MGWISRGACFGVMVTAIFYYWLYSGPQVSQTWKDTYEYIVGGSYKDTVMRMPCQNIHYCIVCWELLRTRQV